MHSDPVRPDPVRPGPVHSDPGHSEGERPRGIPILSWAAGLAGIVTLVVGTFLPWVVSGTVQRNIYTITGIADRMGLLGSGSPAAHWLPLVGPLCVSPALLVALGLRRTGAVWAIVLAVACGGFAGAVLGLAGGRSVAGIELATSGPVTVVIGSLLLAGGGIGQLAASTRHRVRARRGSRQTATNGVADRPH